MRYNVVKIVEQWGKTGLLDNFDNLKDIVALARALERCGSKLFKLAEDNDLEDERIISSIAFSSVVSIYNAIYGNPYMDANIRKYSLNLRDNNHELDVYEIIDLSIEKVEEYPEDDIILTFGTYEIEIVTTVTENYLIKHGTI